MNKESFLIEGIINYHTTSRIGGEYDSFFLLPNGFIGEIGISATTARRPMYLLHYVDGEGVEHSRSNVPGPFYERRANFDQVLAESPDLKIGIWYDQRTNQLRISRDVFGFAPLYYSHIAGQYFAFSTDIRRLVRMPEVAKRAAVNVSKIVLHNVSRHKDYSHDASSTFFTSVESLLPGHILSVDENGCNLTRYVRLKPERWRHLRTTGEYTDALRQEFKNAVKQCIPDEGVIGSHLSGGLDSSSVVSMARHLQNDADLHTFHALTKSDLSNEAIYAETVAREMRSSHHIIIPPPDDLKVIEFTTHLYGQPDPSFLSPAGKVELIANAGQHGCRILLNGIGGDSVIGSGFELIKRALRNSDWNAYHDLLRQRSKYSPIASNYENWDSFSDSKKFDLALQNSLYLYFSQMPGRSLSKLIQLYRAIPGHMKPSSTYFANRYFTGLFSRIFNNSMATGGHISVLREDIERQYTAQVSPVSFPTTIRGDLPESYQEIFEDVFHPQVIKGQEEYFFLGKHFGVTSHSPFMNRELFELNLAIPDTVKFGDGIGRAHLRDAMIGILPDKIRFRSTKATMSSSDGHAMTVRLYQQAKPYLFENKEIWQYIDRKKFDEQVRIVYNMRVPYLHKTQSYFLLTRAISLAVWLEWLKTQSLSKTIR